MIKDINNIDSNTLQEDDRIEAYLKGKMSADEEQLFLKDLEEKPELKEKAIVLARLVKGLKDVGAEQDKDTIGAFMASSEQNVESIAKKAIQQEGAAIVSKSISLRKTSTWLSIAASLIFVVWFGFEYIDYRKTTGLGDQYGNAFSTEMIARGEAKGDVSEATEQKLQKLFSDVKENKNLDNAIHELSLCWELSTMETYNDYTNYSAEIGWNLAIAYLKDNNKKEAKKVLDKLIATSEDGSAINAKAEELLSIIGK